MGLYDLTIPLTLFVYPGYIIDKDPGKHPDSKMYLYII